MMKNTLVNLILFIWSGIVTVSGFAIATGFLIEFWNSETSLLGVIIYFIAIAIGLLIMYGGIKTQVKIWNEKK